MASDPSNKYTKVTKTQSMGSIQLKKISQYRDDERLPLQNKTNFR